MWRITSDAPQGEFVDFDPTVGPPVVKAVVVPLRVIDPAPVVSWHASSYDLLNGVDVIDQTNSIPGALFDKLFKH